jgi:DNA-binding beta-propeller fold protein YncE/DNA-directed RNA polymerase subunit RPC12/RpoP
MLVPVQGEAMSDTMKLFNCPACGAPLEPPAGLSVMKCAYCKSSIIVPGAINTAGATGMSGPINMEKVVQFLLSGNKVEAIKIFHQMTGSGLVEAKNVVDAIERGEAIDITRFLTMEPTGGRSLGSLESEGRVPPQKSQQVTFPDANAQIVSTQRKRSGCTIVGVAFALLLFGGVALAFLNFRKPDTGGSIISSIEEFSPSPTPSFASPVLSFGGEGTGAGMLNDPRSVGVDRSGNIYVGNYSDGRIQIFDAQGNFLKLINVGSDAYIASLAVAPDGTFYTCYGGDIHHFDSSGQDQGTLIYDNPPEMAGYFEYIAIGADGSLYAVDSNESIARFGPDGMINLIIPDVFSAVTDHPELDMILAVDGLGNIYVLGTFNNLVLKYNPGGKYLDQFGGDTQHPAEGMDPGRFQAPDAIAVDGYGRIYVSDIWGIQVFDSNGQYKNFFDIEGVAFGMTFDLNNVLYVASNKPQIIKIQIQRP